MNSPSINYQVNKTPPEAFECELQSDFINWLCTLYPIPNPSKTKTMTLLTYTMHDTNNI